MIFSASNASLPKFVSPISINGTSILLSRPSQKLCYFEILLLLSHESFLSFFFLFSFFPSCYACRGPFNLKTSFFSFGNFSLLLLFLCSPFPVLLPLISWRLKLLDLAEYLLTLIHTYQLLAFNSSAWYSNHYSLVGCVFSVIWPIN